MSTAIDHCGLQVHGGRNAVHKLRPWTSLIRQVGLSMLGAATAFIGQAAHAQSPWMQQPVRAVVQPTANLFHHSGTGPIQQTVGHAPTDPRAGLDPRIDAMPTVDQKMEVIHHRSQLIRTRQRIARTMSSAAGVIDIVPYSETEFSILGMQLGTTDLLIWFENDSEPLKYAVTVIRDPALDDQRRIDYGKIERKLQILYPNSKVWLIPLSRRVIVRGEAPRSRGSLAHHADGATRSRQP